MSTSNPFTDAITILFQRLNTALDERRKMLVDPAHKNPHSDAIKQNALKIKAIEDDIFSMKSAQAQHAELTAPPPPPAPPATPPPAPTIVDKRDEIIAARKKKFIAKCTELLQAGRREDIHKIYCQVSDTDVVGNFVIGENDSEWWNAFLVEEGKGAFNPKPAPAAGILQPHPQT